MPCPDAIAQVRKRQDYVTIMVKTYSSWPKASV